MSLPSLSGLVLQFGCLVPSLGKQPEAESLLMAVQEKTSAGQAQSLDFNRNCTRRDLQEKGEELQVHVGLQVVNQTRRLDDQRHRMCGAFHTNPSQPLLLK